MIIFDKKCVDCSEILTNENWNDFNKSVNNIRYRCKLCISKRNRNRNFKIKKKIVDAYGNECSCCKENHFEFLTIDHIFSDGAEHSKIIGKGSKFYYWLIKNDFPKDRYQLMCWNCNRAKYLGNCCPHQINKIFNIEDYKQTTLYHNDFNSKIKICIFCGKILSKDNMYDLKNHRYICKECSDLSSKYYNLKIKLDIFENYGNKCVCCEEDIIYFLNIDHINNNGAGHRKELGMSNTGGGINFYYWLKKNNYPKDNYQILCSNCNSAKYLYGQCPHIIERQQNLILPQTSLSIASAPTQ